MKTIVISASSDIGAALCTHWRAKGWDHFGTYRTHSPLVEDLEKKSGVSFTHCDLSNKASIEEAAHSLAHKCPCWDVLVFAAGLMEPIGPFIDVDFDAWEKGVSVNLLQPLRLLHRLLPFRNIQGEPCVLFFAAGGTNNAVPHYTSYALSKVALIKMCEFLAAEMPDTRFAIIGPGWVKTKIHEATFQAGAAAGANYERTAAKYASGDWISMQEVIDCCHWLATSPCNAVSGRNFSVGFDAWGSTELEQALARDNDMYKLRRHGNHFMQKPGN